MFVVIRFEIKIQIHKVYLYGKGFNFLKRVDEVVNETVTEFI